LPKLPTATGQDLIRALVRAGFVRRRQAGSHVVLKHPERRLTVSVPAHAGRPLSRGLLHDLIKQAGLTTDEFAQLLK